MPHMRAPEGQSDLKFHTAGTKEGVASGSDECDGPDATHDICRKLIIL